MTTINNLVVGDNNIDVDITAQDGSTTQTYNVNVRRKDIASITATPSAVNGNTDVDLTASLNLSAGYNTSQLSYAWTSNGGGSFANANVKDATWTAPAATANDQTITLTLTVSHSSNTDIFPATATVEVTVNGGDVPEVTITSPDASDDAPQAIVNGDVDVTLEATTSDAATYLWTATPNVGTFADSTAEDTTWTAPAATGEEQDVTLTLTATNAEGVGGVASVVVRVRAENVSFFSSLVGSDAVGVIWHGALNYGSGGIGTSYNLIWGGGSSPNGTSKSVETEVNADYVTGTSDTVYVGRLEVRSDFLRLALNTNYNTRNANTSVNFNATPAQAGLFMAFRLDDGTEYSWDLSGLFSSDSTNEYQWNGVNDTGDDLTTTVVNAIRSTPSIQMIMGGQELVEH